MSKRFIIDSVNKIKGENCEQFDGSIFSEVYYSAARLVETIVDSNESYKEWSGADKFANENQIFNVISFLGERGMGKSSAMLSFAYYLKNYCVAKEKTQERYHIDIENQDSFYVLSKVDTAMMGAGENILDIVLAKMWDAFTDKANTFPKMENKIKQAKNSFSKVKQSYSEYLIRINNSEKLRRSSQLTELHELSDSLNLRSAFAEVVEEFLRFEDDSYLVISIDDLDIVKGNAYNILEQIRLFFTIPKVIVLITADIERLALNISSIFSDQLLYSAKVKDNEMKQIQGYAQSYLAKILPRNTRIYMPVFNGIEQTLELKYDDYRELLDSIYTSDPGGGISEKRLTFDIMAKYMDILMYPMINTYTIRHKSLRNTVNNVNELIKMSRAESNDFQMFYQWIQKELLISCNDIEKTALRTFAQSLLYADEDICNYYIVNWSFGEFPEGEQIISEPGYGKVINKIIELTKTYFRDMEFGWILIWIYSLVISKMLHTGQNIEQAIIKNDIFSSSLIRKEKSGFEQEREIAPILSTKLEKKEGDQNIIIANSKYIVDTFKLLLLTDIDYIIENAYVKKSKCSSDSIIIEFESISSKISIDYFFSNILFYKQKWKKYITWFSGIVNKQKKIIDVNKDWMEIQKKENVGIEKFQEWDKQFAEKKITDILPLQNVGVMLEINKQIRSMEIDLNKQGAIKYVSDIVRIINKTLLMSETTYNLDSIERGDLKYSKRLSELCDIVNIQNISEERDRDVFSVAGYGVKDASLGV